jgi:hypothetical protein
MTATATDSPIVQAPVEFVFGLDLAQQSDYSALALLKLTTPDGRRLDSSSLPFMNDLVSLTRWRGVPYPEQVRRVAKLVADPRLRPIVQPPARAVGGGAFSMRDAPAQAPKPKLVIDATGVGVAVVDLFLMAPEIRAVADVVPLTITGGEGWRKDRWGAGRSNVVAYWVAKKALVSLIVARLQGERLRFRPGDRLAAELEDELRNFRVKMTRAANEQFEARDGKTDDLILAVSMALWVSENGLGKLIRVVR